MKDFNHVNVLHLIGVVIEKHYVVLPFMENGDLRSFISRPKQVNQQSSYLSYSKNQNQIAVSEISSLKDISSMKKIIMAIFSVMEKSLYKNHGKVKTVSSG